MRIATWNVNGVRARWDEIVAWSEAEDLDVFCLQEIKATAFQIPEPLTGLPDYWSFWHGDPGGYSGVSLHVHRRITAEPPPFTVPGFDFETRIAQVALDGLTVASVYVPNGNKDFEAKTTFLEAMREHVAAVEGPLVVCGDLNVTLTDADVHPRQRKKGAIGQRPEERRMLSAVIEDGGLVDVGRALAPDDDGMFTWWPPWRGLKDENQGWRIDYALASRALFERVARCRVLRDFGTSDHAPLLVDFDL